MSDPSLEETKVFLQRLASAVDFALNGAEEPKPNGFVLLVFPTDDTGEQGVNYVSNCDRKDMIAALKSVVARFEGQSMQGGRA